MSLRSFQEETFLRFNRTIMAAFLASEILNNIFRYVDVSPQQLLICRSWYHPIHRRLLEDIQLSPSALLRMPLLSDKFAGLLCRYTCSVSIILNYQNVAHRGRKRYCTDTFDKVPVPYSDAWVYGINAALTELARRLPLFRRLRSYTFCNFLEIETSWNIIHVSTFETIIASLSNHSLDFVKIDMPGADLENRLQLYAPWDDKPHGCEIISKYFPQTRHLHLRMREICSDVLQFEYSNQTLLETFVIDLNLEPNTLHQLEQDSFVTDCSFSERFGERLLQDLASNCKRLSHCSKVPNIQRVLFLCKGIDSQWKSSGSVSYNEAATALAAPGLTMTERTSSLVRPSQTD